MTVLFLSDNFPPESNAPATRTYEHCREWVKQGVRVIVITCFPNFPTGKVFPGYKNKLYSKEVVDGIIVIRVWSFISPNTGIIKRTLDFLSFCFTSFWCGLFIKSDVIVATSPQFFTAVSGYLLSIFKRTKWVMEVRDLWPESIKAVNAIETNFVLRFLEKVELFLYRRASRIIVVTDSFKKNIASRGIPAHKIRVVKNGVDLNRFFKRDKNQDLSRKLDLNGHFIIGYIGTHGLAHGLDFVVKTANKIGDDILFLFIGDGAEKENLKKRAIELGVKNIRFLDSVSKEEVPEYLSLIDAALVPLRKATTFEGVIPSKIFEIAAMGKPILLGVKGETQKIIESYQAGVFYEPEEEVDFLSKLHYLKSTMTSKDIDYEKGCDALARDFNRTRLASLMLDELKEVVQSTRYEVRGTLPAGRQGSTNEG